MSLIQRANRWKGGIDDRDSAEIKANQWEEGLHFKIDDIQIGLIWLNTWEKVLSIKFSGFLENFSYLWIK
jgi:hypothetical protein